MRADLLKGRKRRALDYLALILALIPDLNRWSKDEKKGLQNIIRAKAGLDEAQYLKLLQKHSLLRAAIIKLGSSFGRRP